MTRRTLLAHLDAQMERPEERQFTFDPVQLVISDRGIYVAACLTIVRAYLLAGCPGKLPQLASFGTWSDLVRSALVWLGCADPAQSIHETRRSDPVLDTLHQVLHCWRRCYGHKGQHARKVAADVAASIPAPSKARPSLLCARHWPPSRPNAGKLTHQSSATGCAGARTGSSTARSSLSSAHHMG